MPTGYATDNVDFDDQFDPDVMGDGPTAPGYAVGGVPLRYAAVAYGTRGPDTGYSADGVGDLANLWAKKGSAVYASSTLGLPDLIYANQTGTTSPQTATAAFTMYRDGSTTTFPAGPPSAWFAGSNPTVGDGYDVEFSVISGIGSGTINGDPLDTRLRLNTSRALSLSVQQVTSGARSASRQIRIRLYRRSDNALLVTRSTTLEAEADIS